ncbi:MAG: helix-turn-helix domain-containing protein [Roseburia sp.]|nr:helix-turn-helix domain-containing protein [Roseburia sp.]MCM1279541.1 helix-turn-helix domain-containing protein [Robinsoniella sp.]
MKGATEGEPKAVDEVLQYYSRRIHYTAIENGHVNPDAEDSIKSRLVAALCKFRFDEREV